MNAVERAIASRLSYLRRELEIAEREAARDPLNVAMLRPEDRAPFEAANREIEAARQLIPMLRAEIAELDAARTSVRT